MGAELLCLGYYLIRELLRMSCTLKTKKIDHCGHYLKLANFRHRVPLINCGILVSRIGGSGDQGGKWEEMGERAMERDREGERESVEKCCFCLQNDLKEP